MAGLPNAYYEGQFNRQKRDTNDQQLQLNQQRIAAGQRQQQLAEAFQSGGALDSKGNYDPVKAQALFARFGVLDGMTQLQPQVLQKQAMNAPQSPMLTGGPQQAPAVSSQASVAAPSARGGDAAGSVISQVTDALGDGNPKIGVVAGNIASSVGADANGALTPGQAAQVRDRLAAYLKRNNIAPTGGGAASAAPLSRPSLAEAGQDADATPSQRVAGAFGALPPSANAGTPAAQPAPQQKPQGAPNGAPSAQPAAPVTAQPQGPVAQPMPQAPPQPQGQPIVPQVPLPKGFTDPQAAILALKQEAARVSRQPGPGAKADAEALSDWASRIEKSIQPVPMRPGETLLDPRTAQPIYQGNQPTLSPDAINAAAERYLESGQLPPNMGRGVQGAATMSAIQNHAAEIANQRGIDMGSLPQKWQQFKAQQVAIQRFTSGPQGNTIRSFNVLVDHLDTLTDAAAALKNGDNRMLNRFKQNWAANTGSTAPTNFDGVKALVGDEIVKAVVGSAGALADREEVKKDLDRASSPAQLAELVEKYKKLALGQLHGLQKQYETSTGLKNFGSMLLPGTLKALGGGGAEGEKPAPTVSKDGWTVVTAPNGKKARIQEITE
ncbi:hypothetical protein FHR88_000533 [Bradyrhizobium betae]|nr:hypothetical protein [Bradyrhizobium betae]